MRSSSGSSPTAAAPRSHPRSTGGGQMHLRGRQVWRGWRDGGTGGQGGRGGGGGGGPIAAALEQPVHACGEGGASCATRRLPGSSPPPPSSPPLPTVWRLQLHAPVHARVTSPSPPRPPPLAGGLSRFRLFLRHVGALHPCIPGVCYIYLAGLADGARGFYTHVVFGIPSCHASSQLTPAARQLPLPHRLPAAGSRKTEHPGSRGGR
jgi:hypothetical protein